MMITEIEDYFAKGCGRCDRFDTPDCSTRQWSGGLAELRRICLDVGLVETVKWGHPCFMHADRNIAVIGAFLDNFRLSFFESALLTDPDRVLEKQGAFTQHPNMLCFRGNAEVVEREPTIRAYLTEAMGYAEAGIRAPKVEREIELPEELVDAMDADPEPAEAFEALTPGRRRSYTINLASAKKPETRISRIQKFRPKILAGKGAQER